MFGGVFEVGNWEMLELQMTHTHTPRWSWFQVPDTPSFKSSLSIWEYQPMALAQRRTFSQCISSSFFECWWDRLSWSPKWASVICSFDSRVTTPHIVIIITRPKPAYGRQGLAGSWGQDTDEVSTFLVFLTSHFAPAALSSDLTNLGPLMTMKIHLETLKNHGNQPKTMKNNPDAVFSDRLGLAEINCNNSL